MKKSFYNLFIPYSRKYILYNTLTGSINIIDQKLKKQIVDNELKKLPKEVISLLKASGDIIEDDLKEKDLVLSRFLKQKYNYPRLDIMVTLSYLCNLRCPYCFEAWQTKPAKIDSEKIASIVNFIEKQIVARHSKKLLLQVFGGEPFVTFDEMIELLEKVKKMSEKKKIDYTVIIYSNGTLINEENAKKLKKYNIRFIQISMDGEKDFHNTRKKLVNGKGAYDLAIKGLKILKELNLKPVIRINVIKEHPETAINLLKELKDLDLLGIPIGFGFIRPMTNSCKHYPGNTNNQELNDLIPYLYKEAIKLGAKISLKPKTRYIYCSGQADSSYVIDPNLDVYKCAGLQGNIEHRIGVLNQEGELEKQSKVYDDWMKRNPFENKNCLKCKTLPICGGGCGATAFVASGKYKSNDCFGFGEKLVKKEILMHVEKISKDKK